MRLLPLLLFLACTSRSGESGPDDTDADTDPTADTGTDCVQAALLWSEDFETGDYSRWTSSDYGADWNGGACHDNGFSTEQSVSPSRSHRSEITCAIDQSHRGYGGLQFSGDAPLPDYTNTGAGIEAPHGVVNTWWVWLETPHEFRDGRWYSLWTVNNSCDWSDTVLTLGLEDTTWRLTPAHVEYTGGTVTFADSAPAFELGRWVRITLLVDYYASELRVWQDGEAVVHAQGFARGDTDLCQWHWGAYASGDNSDVVLYEDDFAIWELGQPWTDPDVEPWLGHAVPLCEG